MRTTYTRRRAPPARKVAARARPAAGLVAARADLKEKLAGQAQASLVAPGPAHEAPAATAGPEPAAPMPRGEDAPG